MRLKFLIIALFSLNISFSQSNDAGSWHIVSLRVELNKKWEAFGEIQTRSNRLVHDFSYYEIKGGVSYELSKSLSLLMGTGRYASYAGEGNFNKPYASEEFRIWQQLTMNQYVNRLKIEHRYRLEQRWRSDGYRNRFRYRVSVVSPLNKKSMDAGAFYINIYDEIFLNGEVPHFERNRFFSGVGYLVSSLITLQTGYVHQYNYSLDKKERKNYLQAALLLKF